MENEIKNDLNQQGSFVGESVAVINNETKGDNVPKADTPPEKNNKPKRTIKERLKSLIPSKRRLIQLYSALLFNANIKGFIKGEIFIGASKNICAPGINCYSCPGAVMACPLGALQAELNRANKSSAFYVVGILLLYGIIAGRTICGWLCPFGFIQELLHKIKTPKLKKNKVTRVFSYLKYVLLVFFVIIIPILYGIREVELPAFCKYICPAGTLEGAFGLLSNAVNESYLSILGPLFTWKFLLFVSIAVGSIFIFRFFCRFICPLGAIYGFFNKFSLLGIKLNRDKCTNCGLCVTKCEMDIKHVGDHECISCGECVSVCPTKAITFKGGSFFLPPDDIDPQGLSEKELAQAREENEKKRASAKKRSTIFRAVICSVMAVLLGTAIVYYNFIDKGSTQQSPPPAPPATDDGPVVGTQIGNILPDFSLEIFDENGFVSSENQTLEGPFGKNEDGTLTFNPSKNSGKVTIINFWGTWCPGCVAELPYFDRIASEYKDKVSVLAIHTDYRYQETASEYVLNNYKDSDIIFLKDIPLNEEIDKYYTDLGGKLNMYPFTVILGTDGKIIASLPRSVTYDELKGIVDTELEAEKPPVGTQIGNTAPGFDLVVFDENGTLPFDNQASDPWSSTTFDGNQVLTFNPSKNSGKITIINFWGTWCPGCVAELPYFDRIASEYKDKVTVVAIHTDYRYKETASDYVLNNYESSEMIFAKDEALNSDIDKYYTDLGGKLNMYPFTVILDENGVIIASLPRSVTYEELKSIVDTNLQ
ncbi:MAG: redoxin family protein [Clostridia bacterium]|nr:redoxin family protein [Clostridia bacterium]